MVSMSREVWLVRHLDTKELRYELRKDFRRRVVNPPGDEGVRGDPTERGGDWEYLRTVVQDDELLTVTPSEAVEFGLASRIVSAPDSRPYDAMLATFNAAGIEPIIPEDSWSERLVTYLTHPAVVSILVLVGLMAFYSEAMAPGLGIPAAVAVCCFALVFGAPYLTGLATWWEIGLFVLGVVLIALEVFVIPGFGVAGISGIVCCAVGFLGIFIANAPDELPLPMTDYDWSRLAGGALAMLVAIIGSALGLVMLTKYFPDMPLLNRMALTPGQLDDNDVGVSESAPVRRISVGDVGVVESVCRPIGAVRFGEYLLDAESEGSVIATGKKVRVLRRDGNYVVVEEIWDA
jgi:membrane-bound serine protease (ClpP class)